MRALLAVAVLVGCHHGSAAPARDDAAELRELMAQYDRYTVAIDAEGLASMFAPDGELVGADDQVQAHGPVAIRELLAPYKDKFLVLEAKTVVTDVQVSLDSAHVTGTFEQRVVVLGPDPALLDNHGSSDRNRKQIHAHGTFDSNWKRAERGWLLTRMKAVPDPK